MFEKFVRDQLHQLDAMQMFDMPLCCIPFNTAYRFGLIVNTPQEDGDHVTRPYAIGDQDGHYAPIPYCPFCRANLTRDMQSRRGES